MDQTDLTRWRAECHQHIADAETGTKTVDEGDMINGVKGCTKVQRHTLTLTQTFILWSIINNFFDVGLKLDTSI